MTKEFSQSETIRVGLLGVGLVGSALARRLSAAGYEVVGFDPAPEAVVRLAEYGVESVDSEREVGRRCRRFLLSLPGSTEVEAVVEKLMDELQPGDLILDTTTGHPDAVERVAGKLASRGVEYLDATLGGSSRQIAAGEAIVICGASECGYAAAEDLLQAIGSRVFHTGPAGTGTRMKLVMNLVLGLERAVLAEGLEFARSSGIDPECALEVLRSGPAYSKVMDTKGEKMLRGDFQPEARLAQHWKDVRLMLQTGNGNGARLPLTTIHEGLLRSAFEAGWGGEDNSAIIKVFQERQP